MADHQFCQSFDYQEWDQYVSFHPQGTIFHQNKWLSRLGGEVKIWVARHSRSKRIIGGIPLIKTKKRGIKGCHIPPYTPYGGPLFGDAKNAKHFNSTTQLLAFHRDLFNSIPKTKILDFKLLSGLINILPYKWNGFTESIGVTYTVEGSMAMYQNRIHKNKLREIRNVERLVTEQKLMVEIIQDPDRIIDLQIETSRRGGFKAHKKALRSLLRDFDPSFMHAIALKTQKNEDISIVFLLFDNKRVYNLINASSSTTLQKAKTANLYAIFLAIDFAFSKSLKFDFEGSLIPGVEQFYRLMGGVQEPVFRFTKIDSWLLNKIVHGIKSNE